ncbi:heat-shock protein Hsp20 [Pseudooceanicola lipolyticus]|uniref:Heat-shock protein Hsp20 n=1 Tax=Pseudooceanicola lipolyticus TaxID=2029104 RepID=A0A2M8J0G8_9RHOB|nr:Hsp20/alpha crystallin family protein [Pseudooceanicola lipolyticus]PJE36255.1 heat-shock protein Hsp20 [Pseudooceanicola lipolyticus]
MAKDVSNPGKRETDMPETTHGGRVYRPLADIVETGDGVQLMLEMPGVSRDDLDVTLEKRVLTIRGKVHPTAPDKLDLVHAEYGEGDYERSFSMSQDFDPDKIEASLSNGILTLTLPRAEAAKPKKIAVRAA